MKKHEIDALDERAPRPKMTALDAKDFLARQYKIDSAFVRVVMLAKILGISSATIYSAVRAGRFFLPHKMLCSMPAFRLDDLAEWYCQQDQPATVAVRRQRDERAEETAGQQKIDDKTREAMIARALAKARAERERAGSELSGASVPPNRRRRNRR
ncbi:helix-turn-helix transcriptional regulator [Burkholderia glumae]|uniref:helix-turn-helix transcriptional regulator n=1 Tax=Burkholderia glumae TaxID=337 RepID=UPI0012FD3918|nr:hypothetical protein [Burkholderia glumae]QHE11527.1 hypothetical protein GQR88_14605 [Burkholderia glumae AU6208]